MRDVYSTYQHDDRLSLLTILPEFGQKGVSPHRMNTEPWTQAAGLGTDGAALQILNTNFTQNVAWLIGPDGKVIARDLTGDAIKSAVTSAIGAPQATSQPSTMP